VQSDIETVPDESKSEQSSARVERPLGPLVTIFKSSDRSSADPIALSGSAKQNDEVAADIQNWKTAVYSHADKHERTTCSQLIIGFISSRSLDPTALTYKEFIECRASHLSQFDTDNKTDNKNSTNKKKALTKTYSEMAVTLYKDTWLIRACIRHGSVSQISTALDMESKLMSKGLSFARIKEAPGTYAAEFWKVMGTYNNNNIATGVCRYLRKELGVDSASFDHWMSVIGAIKKQYSFYNRLLKIEESLLMKSQVGLDSASLSDPAQKDTIRKLFDNELRSAFNDFETTLNRPTQEKALAVRKTLFPDAPELDKEKASQP
jgi:hypothetical protein